MVASEVGRRRLQSWSSTVNTWQSAGAFILLGILAYTSKFIVQDAGPLALMVTMAIAAIVLTGMGLATLFIGTTGLIADQGAFSQEHLYALLTGIFFAALPLLGCLLSFVLP
jgi:hypothetical protein